MPGGIQALGGMGGVAFTAILFQFDLSIRVLDSYPIDVYTFRLLPEERRSCRQGPHDA